MFAVEFGGRSASGRCGREMPRVRDVLSELTLRDSEPADVGAVDWSLEA